MPLAILQAPPRIHKAIYTSEHIPSGHVLRGGTGGCLIAEAQSGLITYILRLGWGKK